MQASTSMTYEMVKEKVISYLAALSLEERSIAFIHLYPKNKDHSPFLLDETVPFSYYATISNDLVTITSLATQEDAWTLPHYFQSHLKSAANSLFEPMESLIGDVDPHYYLDQVWTILDKIQQQRRGMRSWHLRTLRESPRCLARRAPSSAEVLSPPQRNSLYN